MEKTQEDIIEELLEHIDKLEKELASSKKELSKLVKEYSWSQGFITPLRPEHMRSILVRRKQDDQNSR